MTSTPCVAKMRSKSHSRVTRVDNFFPHLRTRLSLLGRRRHPDQGKQAGTQNTGGMAPVRRRLLIHCFAVSQAKGPRRHHVSPCE